MQKAENEITTFDTCCASSRVGTKMSTEVALQAGSLCLHRQYERLVTASGMTYFLSTKNRLEDG